MFVEFCSRKATTGQNYRGREYFLADPAIADSRLPASTQIDLQPGEFCGGVGG